jgi:hypothetical protein
MFKSIWPKLLGYLDAVKEGWQCDLQHADEFRRLDHKFRNTAKSLKRWSQKNVGSIRLQLAIAREVVFKLKQAQDSRALSAAEQELPTKLKFKSLGLASMARVIARQRSRLTFLRDGDANTRFFHL